MDEKARKALIKIYCPYFGAGLTPKGFDRKKCETCPFWAECFREFKKWFIAKPWRQWIKEKQQLRKKF